MNEIKKPLLSVLVPVYNVAPYLGKCLDSIINQTFRDIEIICIDDGATDESGNILDEYARHDSRIIVKHKRNGGLVSARKEAIKYASGLYATCVDSDDWIDSDMLEQLMELATKNEADVVTSGCIREYSDSQSVDGDILQLGIYKGSKLQSDVLSRLMARDICFQQNIKTTIWGKIYRVDLLRKFQMQVPNEVNVGEDSAVVYPYLLNSTCVVVSGANYYHYRIRQESVATSKSKNEEKSLECIESILKHEFLSHADEVENAEYQYKAITLFNRLVVCPETVIKINNNTVYPFPDVKKTDRVVIYGVGRFGKRLKSCLQNLGVNIVATVDQNAIGEVESVEEIATMEFDKVIIAVLKSNLAREMLRTLERLSVDKVKIQIVNVDKLII